MSPPAALTTNQGWRMSRRSERFQTGLTWKITWLQQACNFQWLRPLIISWSTSFAPASVGGPMLIWDLLCLKVSTRSLPHVWCWIIFWRRVKATRTSRRKVVNHLWNQKTVEYFYISSLDAWGLIHKSWTFNSKRLSAASILLFSGWPSVVWAVWRLIFRSRSISAEVQWFIYLFTTVYETCFKHKDMKCRRKKKSDWFHRRCQIHCRKHIFLYKWCDVVCVQWERIFFLSLVVTVSEFFWKILNLGFISLSVQLIPWNLIMHIPFIRFIRGNWTAGEDMSKKIRAWQLFFYRSIKVDEAGSCWARHYRHTALL